MKKQLLIVLMALFAIGLSSSYGQTVTCPIPRTVDPICLPSDALHPVAGTPYNYTVSVPTPVGTKEYTWFVTQDPAFMAAGVLTANRETVPGLHIAATGTGYNNPATGSPTLSITWKSFVLDPALPVFVVIHVKNTASTSDACVTNNVKVFKILPKNAFTLDIANVNAAGVAQGYETPIDRCIHDVVTATYDATAPEGVIYDFGVDYLYYVVTAANFSSSWKPSAQLTGVNALDSVTAVEWARPDNFATAFATPHAMPRAGITYTSTDSVAVIAGSGFVGAAGECILIRVTIDHTTVGRQYQGLTDEVITLAVDGITAITATPPIPDVHYSSTLPVANANCGLPDGFLFDKAVQTIKPRPDITAPAMPAPGFLPVK
jgi:hypothetical protein